MGHGLGFLQQSEGKACVAPEGGGVNGSGGAADQRLLKFGVRFSTKACMPSRRSSAANVE
jgi:hypothetical protein